MPRIKRITRRDIRRNELAEAVQKVALFIKHNPRRVLQYSAIAGGCLIFLFIASSLVKRAMNIPKEELSQVLFAYHYGGPSEDVKQGFVRYKKKHKGKLSDIAWVYKGISERKLNEYATSTETLSSFLEKNKDHYLSSSCLVALGNIAEEEGDYKKAIEYYKEAQAKNDYLYSYTERRIEKLNEYMEKPAIGTPTANIP
ncbi:TPA: hypothetical protein DCX16_05370 [bacterium]|nr:hypothetical protein [bacterium]